MSLTKPERETVILLNDEDEYAVIYSAQRKWITRLKKNPAAKLLSEDANGCNFEIPAALISVRTKRRTRKKSPGQG